MPNLTEDDIYRTSSQYRNWSFTPDRLAAQRLETNIQASERVKAAFARQRAQRLLKPETTSADTSDTGSGIENGNEIGANTAVPRDKSGEVNCLTAAEEMRIVDAFCERAIELGAFLNFPTEVTATGVQYFRRFYLLNSPMTYDPQTIVRSIMFIANKSEGHHHAGDAYAHALGRTKEMILAPEFMIVQALRFNFEVRHPFRGLKGGHMEIMEMAKGNAASLPTLGKSAEELQKEIVTLPRKTGGTATNMTTEELEKRILDAYGFASHILKSAALLTDAYFLYTPSHIWLSAHLLADEPLTLFYLNTKIPLTSPIYNKLLTTLRSCSALLTSHRSWDPKASPTEKETLDKQEKAEIKVLMDKLKLCRDPDKVDLVKLNQAQKRDALAQDGELEQSKAKRRKLAREGYQKEADEFWGPELVKKN